MSSPHETARSAHAFAGAPSSADVVDPVPATPVPPAPVSAAPAAATRGFTRLVLVELRRYFARDGVRWLLLAMLVAVATTAFGAWRATAPPSQAQLDQAQQAYQQTQADWQAHGAEQVEQCRQAQADAQRTDPTADLGCDHMIAPALEQFLPYRERFAQSVPAWVDQMSTFLLMIALLVGATFVAAELGSGAMGTWLTFEPRRGRVFASKTLVATLATGLAVLVVGALGVGALWAVSASHDALGDVTPQLWFELGDRIGRLAVAGALATLVGTGLAFLFRHTAAALAVAVGWFVAVEGILGGMVAGLRPWTVALNLAAWLQGGYSQWTGARSCTTDASGQTTCDGGVQLVISMTHSGLVLAALAVVVTGIALLVFRRRDVS